MAYQAKYCRPSAKTAFPIGGLLLRIAFVLLVLLVLSVHMMGGLFAKYSTEGSASDSAQVAKFDVVASGVSASDIDIGCITYNADTGSFIFQVTNQSEVSVEYDVRLSYGHDIGYLTASVDGQAEGWIDTSTQGFSNVGTLAPGESRDHMITFKVNWDAFTMGASGSSASADIDFTVTIMVDQVD